MIIVPMSGEVIAVIIRWIIIGIMILAGWYAFDYYTKKKKET